MKCYEGSNLNVQRNFISSEAISLNLQCSVCNEIFNNPMRLDCGHTFCYKCVSDWLRKADQCPNCRVKIVESLVSRDLLAYNLIMELDVVCNNEAKGCPWKGQLVDLVNHMKSCDRSIQLLKENEYKMNLITTITEKEAITPIKHMPSVTQFKSYRNISRSVYKLDSVANLHIKEKNSIELLVKYAREKVIIAPPVLKTEEKKILQELFFNSNG